MIRNKKAPQMFSICRCFLLRSRMDSKGQKMSLWKEWGKEEPMTKILLIEDDKALNQGIALALGQTGYQMIQVESLREARKKWKEEEIELIILDLNLPDGSGYEFLKEIREKKGQKKSEIPVLILTANDLELDVVTGFSLGADDYVTKPFSLMILRARVEALLRRSALKRDYFSLYESQEYYFDFENFYYQKDGKEVYLSKTEQKLLKKLVFHQNQVVTREQLIDAIWTEGGDYVDENALSVAISRLRTKLNAKDSIQTIYGIGYSWVVK